ncbi:mannose-1-phosphate guanylyltransferase [Pseudomonas frederiksbergensis]|uniref:Mannose-1-phosphate guanylyltransferase n=1 Tax=Pseudomonas frederiksbergensis TaxID=104087 RepID=A0A423JZ97_9PSED|nr:mannose-1-phosphate guanylyltransferase [Pseudomonas frederiksbergensis]RON43321.1 mannose-1-phosphate guanylyltransferase [Pseudomonas frederiksbergensis]RON45308.1 mannose-1-phosphate guanylyltransferase [Pseudomonas frederiksbergensis]
MNIAKNSADIEQGNVGVMAWLSLNPSLPSPTETWLGSLLMVERIGVFPSSGEIRRPIRDPDSLLAHLKSLYARQALDVDERNGLKVIFSDWRFRARIVGSDPAIVITVETRCDPQLMPLKTAELLSQLECFEKGIR